MLPRKTQTYPAISSTIVECLVRFEFVTKKSLHQGFGWIHFPSNWQINLYMLNTRLDMPRLRGRLKLEHANGGYVELDVNFIFELSSKASFRLSRLTKNQKKSLSSFFFTYSKQYSFSKIMAFGLPTRHLCKHLRFGQLKDEDDYRQVSQLRYLAYKQAGKIKADSTTMSDDIDKRAIILVARHREKIVASMRLILNSNQEQSEHQRQLRHFPSWLPANENTIEITRVCTHPEYRGSGLLRDFFSYAAEQILKIPREWILGSSTEELLPLYGSLGFKLSSLSYEHKSLAGAKHQLFLASKNELLRARNVHPLSWALVYSQVYKKAKSQRLLGVIGFKDKLKLFFLEQLSSWIHLVKSPRR